MAEVLIDFDSEFTAPDGSLYTAEAVGRERADRLWEVWLEFTPLGGGGASVRTDRETTQPNRENALYWATGLTTTYLEGALERVLAPPLPHVNAVEAPVPPVSAGTPVLDPFHVYAEGEQVLRSQLNALNEDQLRVIARVFDLADEDAVRIADRSELASLIMVGVARRAA